MASRLILINIAVLFLEINLKLAKTLILDVTCIVVYSTQYSVFTKVYVKISTFFQRYIRILREKPYEALKLN